MKIAFAVIAVVLIACVFAYLALVSYTTNYLRRMHTATWAALGKPSFPATRPSMQDFRALILLSGFVLFSNQYKTLNDRRLVRLVWSIRILLAIIFLLGPTLRYGPH
jgi:heme/copper-type cytochrome/quinol oxidase subunit 3